jgi:carboxyl-terminal processing protease
MSGENHKLTLLSFRMPRQRFLIALSLAMALAAGAALERWLLLTGMPSNARSDFRLVAQAWNIIYRYYVDRDAIDPSVMAHKSIEAMTDSLEDTGHSTFLNKHMLKRADTAMNGKLTGIGIEVQMKNRQPVIVAALDGSPALQAGLRAGEVIVQVDGKSVTDLPPNQIVERITGPAGQAVKLTVADPRTGRRSEVSITRASFKVNNVTWQPLPGADVIHLRIALFSDGVAKELRTALLAIQQQGFTNVILDLRDNPGGVMDEAISCASQFLSAGNVLLEKHADQKITPVPVEPGGVAQQVSLVVLVNLGSASASEIVAGAMHDARRAKLVGERTFGTGTVLSQFPLLDGSALLLAVEEWRTPSGRSFWHKGIEPDISIPSEDVIPLRPTLERGMTAQELRAYGDQQLLWAADMLQGKR